MKLALGSAQFGLNYGVTNREGVINELEGRKIIEFAFENGISSIDTAIDYGKAEVKLGEIGVSNWDITTKLPELPINLNYDYVQEMVEKSLERLKINRLNEILLHRPDQLYSYQGEIIYEILNKLKDRGLVNKIGISIYDTENTLKYFHRYHFDVIQIPFNLFDNRLFENNLNTKLISMNVEIQVRSIFLQGLLLQSLEEMPSKFLKWNYLWQEYNNWLQEINMTRIEACMNYVAGFSEIKKVIVGVDSFLHLKEILGIDYSKKIVKPLPNQFNRVEQDLINPVNWNYL